jgi:hypothetical protein
MAIVHAQGWALRRFCAIANQLASDQPDAHEVVLRLVRIPGLKWFWDIISLRSRRAMGRNRYR